MKKAEEYLQEAYKYSEVKVTKQEEVYWQDLFREAVKQAQKDAIDFTVKMCAEEADTKEVISKRWGNYEIVDKFTILQVADKLKKQIEDDTIGIEKES